MHALCMHSKLLFLYMVRAQITARDVDLDLGTAREGKLDSAKERFVRPGSGKPPRPGSGRPGSNGSMRPLSSNRLKSPSPLQKARMTDSPGSNPPNMSDDSAMATVRVHWEWALLLWLRLWLWV